MQKKIDTPIRVYRKFWARYLAVADFIFWSFDLVFWVDNFCPKEVDLFPFAGF